MTNSRTSRVILGIALVGTLGVGAAAGASTGRESLRSEALLDSLQRTAFLYFWNEANPANGLIKDRSADWSPSSIAAVGFGISAICIGIDRGWVSREAGRARILTTLETFWNGPQGSGANGFIGYRGLFYHFLDMNSATRVWESEVSTIDSALLFAGILDARQYFSTEDPVDVEIRTLADALYHRADWNFFRNFNQAILMGWKPGTGFAGFPQWIGYNEAMILYILALGSPTHGVPETAWSAWTSGYSWQTHDGYSYVNFPPLFGHQYSHCWVDFRGIQDAYMRNRQITYFENSRRATLAQRAYCIANPGGWVGYGENTWGLTACDGPNGYRARGAPPAQNDDGTIAPTAAGGSVPFAPVETIACLQHLYDTYRAQLWGPYGFRDAFNLTAGWWGPDYIGIDQGPIIVMIENYRTQATWNRFMQNADVQRGLQRAGFQPAAGIDPPDWSGARSVILSQNEPNPFRGTSTIAFELPAAGHVRLVVHDPAGREVLRLVDGRMSAGRHNAVFDGRNLPGGVYFYSLETENGSASKRCVLIR